MIKENVKDMKSDIAKEIADKPLKKPKTQYKDEIEVLNEKIEELKK